VDVPKDMQVALAVDIAVKERTTKAKKLADKWKETARKYVTSTIKSGVGSFANLNAAFQKQGIEPYKLTGNTEADVEAVGWKIKAYVESQDPLKNT
jgi:hypothetical protein